MSEPTGAVDPGALPPGVTPPSGGGGRFLSDVIVALGFADRETVDQALDASRAPGKKLGTTLVEMGVLSERQLGRAVAERYRLDFLDLSEFDIDPEAVHVIGDAEMRRYEAVPVAFTEDGALVVAMIDPADWLAAEEMAQLTGRRIRRAVAAPFEVTELIARVAETRAGSDAVDDGYGAETSAALPARLTLRPVSKPLGNGALGRDPEPDRRPASVAPDGPLLHPPGEAPLEPKAQHPDEAAAAADAVELRLGPAQSALNEPSTVDGSDTVESAGADQADAERHGPAESTAAQTEEGAESELAPSTPTQDAEAVEPVAEQPGSESPDALSDASLAAREAPASTAGDSAEASDEPSDDPARQSHESPIEGDDGSSPVFGLAGGTADAESDPPALLFKPPDTEPSSGVEAATADSGGADSTASSDVPGKDEASAPQPAPAEETEAEPIIPTLEAPAPASSPEQSNEPAVAAHELAEVRTELTGVRAELDESHAVLDRLRKELDAARGELATTRSRYDGALERAAESERLLAESRAQAGRLEAELAAAQEQARSLREDLTQAREQIERHSEREKDELAELRAQIETMNGVRPEDPAPSPDAPSPPATHTSANGGTPRAVPAPQHNASANRSNDATPASNGAAPSSAPPAPVIPPMGGAQPLGVGAETPVNRASPLNGASRPAASDPSAVALPKPDAGARENGQPGAGTSADGGGTTKARGLKRLIAAVRRL